MKFPEIRNPRLWLAITVFVGVVVWGLVNHYISGPVTEIGSDAPKETTQSARARPPARKQAPLPTTAQVVPPKQIAKRDGTLDPRPNDLDELCKDWVYYRTKILKHTSEGDLRSAARARAAFADINAWLSAYRDDDVYRVCSKYDTPDFINQYR